jgi:hypothetical protein
MSINSVVNDLVTSVSVINALKPLPPTISGYSVAGKDDLALDPAGGQTVQINGTGFLPGATITFDGSAVAVVTFVNANQLTFTSPAKTAGTYTIYVVNSDGGTAIYIPGIIYSLLPTWTTAAGSLGSYYETTSISNTVVASGDAPITYSLSSGSLPTGSTLYANGVITGTAPVDSSSTTYSFTIQATDAQLQDSTRSFSLTINVDAVTWVSPANATTYTSAVNSAISNVALSATDAAGYNVSYSANALPTGLTLTGSNIAGTPTVVADSSTLLTATAATTNRTSTRTINWSITVANDPYFEYNTLLIPGASTTFVDDASTNNFAVTINGDTKPNSFNPYTPGYYSNYFDGTGDYLNPTTGSTALAFGTGDFTVEMWFYPTTTQPAFCGYFGTGANGGDFRIDQQTSGLTPTVNDNITVFITSSIALTLNVWNHIAVARSSTTLKMFINGVQSGSVTNSTNFTCGGNAVWIGKNPANATYNTGYFSNVRAVKGTAVYTTAFTPPTTPLTAISGTQLLTCQSNRFIDNSTNNYTMTVFGDTKIQSFQPFTPNNSYSTYGSGYFDGTGDYLSIPSNAALNNLTGDFTIEAWIYLTGALGSYYFIFTQTGATNATSNWDFIVNGNASGQLRFEAFSGGTQIINLTGTSSVPVNAWTHVAVTRSGSTYTIWMNGISQGTASSASTVNTNALTTYIGQNNNNTYYFPGYITDARLVKGTAVYTSAFTPPATPLTAIANTSLLTLQNNQSVNNNVFLNNSTNNFLVTRAGNTTQGTFSPYGGNWSNYFGGQMVSTLSPSSTKFNLTGDFTLEAWAFPTSLPGGDWGILDARVAGGSASAWLFGISGAGKTQYYDGTARVGATTLTTNSWYHLAWVRSGSVLRGYVNGVLDYYNGSYGTGAISPGSTAPAIGTKDYTIGAAWGTTGYISNLRIVNGTAVYTTSSTTVGATIFTPSTTPLTPITNTTLLTCADSRFIDDSVNNYTITPSSSTISAQRFSPFNPSSVTPTSYSGYFDGSGDYLTVPDNSAWVIDTDYTIEFWLYSTSFPGQYNNIISQRGGASSYWGINYDTSLGWALFWNNGSGETKISRNQNSPLNTWVHIAVVKSGTTGYMFINGTQAGATFSFPSISDVSSPLYIGAWYTPGDYVNGYLSNLRMVKGTAVYTSNFTPSTTPLTAISGTSLLTLQSTTFIDNSTNNFTITGYADAKPTQQNPFGFTSATTNGYTVSTIGGSGYFDGTGDYLYTPNNSTLYLSTNNFTIEFWVYGTNFSSTPNLIRGTNQYSIGILSGSATSLIYYISSNGSTWNLASGVGMGLLNQSTWNHVALVRNGSIFTPYINGVAGVTTTSASAVYQTNGFYLGAEAAGPGAGPLVGYLSDIRIIVGTSVYTSNFVPPSAPLTAIQNSSLLLNMTSAGIYDAAMMNNMETVGDAKLSTAISKFGGSSMYFDGTGDWLILPITPQTSLGPTFTIEAWIYLANTTGTKAIYSQSVANTGGYGYLIFYISGTNLGFYVRPYTGGPETGLLAGTLSATTWTHVAVSVNNTACRIFINGTQVGGTTTIAATTYTPVYSTVGADIVQGYPMNGYIDDLRVTKGYARYTANFTAPTSAFPIY